MTVTDALLDILIVLVAAKVAAELMERLNIPAVVGEILAVRNGRHPFGWGRPGSSPRVRMADEAVRRYLADECLGLRAHPTAAANFFPAARNNSPNWLRRPSSPQRLRADSTYDWMEDGEQVSA